MNVFMLSQTYMKKLEVVKGIIAKAGQINAKVSDHSLLSNLQRRIKQQEGVRRILHVAIQVSLVNVFATTTVNWHGKQLLVRFLKWKIMDPYSNHYRANSWKI